jgi:putative copper export protein
LVRIAFANWGHANWGQVLHFALVDMIGMSFWTGELSPLQGGLSPRAKRKT